MKNILSKVAGLALITVLTLGICGCSNDTETPETVSTPTFDVDSGEVEKGTEVTLSCATEGAKIFYTTDGTTPTASSTEFKTAICITEEVTLKAIAVKDGMNDSSVASVSYTIKPVATPKFSVNSGEVENETIVTITCATKGAKIFYTTDETTPTTSAKEYTAAITITPPMIIKAIAVKENLNDSSIACAEYGVIQEGYAYVPGGTIIGETSPNEYKGVFPTGRNVTLDSFYMGKHEVTQAEYKSLMTNQKVTVNGTEYTLEASPSICVKGSSVCAFDADKDHDNYPVENITFFDAIYYCIELSKKENLEPYYGFNYISKVKDGHITSASVAHWGGNGYRLPTEAEWEYAARGGDPEKEDWNYYFSGANKSEGTSYYVLKDSGADSIGWYCYNNITGITGDTTVTGSAEGCGTHVVGSKAANRLGIYDMSGNVSEWCLDMYGTISPETVTNPNGAQTSSNNVVRGGSWYDKAYVASAFYRSQKIPSEKSNYIGIRVVRNAN